MPRNMKSFLNRLVWLIYPSSLIEDTCWDILWIKWLWIDWNITTLSFISIWFIASRPAIALLALSTVPVFSPTTWCWLPSLCVWWSTSFVSLFINSWIYRSISRVSFSYWSFTTLKFISIWFYSITAGNLVVFSDACFSRSWITYSW